MLCLYSVLHAVRKSALILPCAYDVNILLPEGHNKLQLLLEAIQAVIFLQYIRASAIFCCVEQAQVRATDSHEARLLANYAHTCRRHKDCQIIIYSMVWKLGAKYNLRFTAQWWS